MAKSSVLSRNDQKSTDESSETIDRISELHESVLCHILSFLPIEEAVSTSILSSRWRTLWILVLDINIDDRHLPRRSYDDYNKPRERFSDIVNNVLTLRKGLSMRKLRLHIHYGTSCGTSQIRDWVSAAIADNVEQMDLLFPYGKTIHFPPSLFTCKSIVVLKLDGCRTLHTVLSTVYLPKLKTFDLNIKRIEEDSAASLNRFLSGCPTLEDSILRVKHPFKSSICINVPCFVWTETIVVLKLTSITLDNFSTLYFPKLRTFILEHIGFSGPSPNLFLSRCSPILEDLELCIYNESNSSINISVPCSLVVLKLHGYITVDNLSSVYLPNLKTLSLDDQAFELCFRQSTQLNWFLSRCPIMEEFYFMHFSKSSININLPRSIVVLKLTGPVNLDNLYLPKLKTLSMQSDLTIEGDMGSNLNCLLSNCTVLEHLCLLITCGSLIKISVPSLKRLDVWYWERKAAIQFQLNTPSLEHLRIKTDRHSPRFSGGNLQNLVSADIYISNGNDEDNETRSHRVAKLLRDIYKVKILLFLSERPVDVTNQDLPEFQNLVRLSFKLVPSWHWLVNWLQKCPKLQVLIIHFNGRANEPNIPDCVASALTEVEYNTSSREDLMDLNVVEYFLKNANSLKKMKIDKTGLGMTPFQKGYFLQKLSLLQNRYDTCKLEVNPSVYG
ncbi:hypothetical protein L6164_035902 [Bauhinia variegata]|uniref:Uncharacterized protein n=1 Tax=Bauhinia variegata TaxID=167791 RepID=A0ACB9KFG7_BAUVA|nr:hypothetical protein L6164_035902 [Bauhinia variegata]